MSPNNLFNIHLQLMSAAAVNGTASAATDGGAWESGMVNHFNPHFLFFVFIVQNLLYVL